MTFKQSASSKDQGTTFKSKEYISGFDRSSSSPKSGENSKTFTNSDSRQQSKLAASRNNHKPTPGANPTPKDKASKKETPSRSPTPAPKAGGTTSR